MKKLFLGFAVVATLASCSKNETIDNPGIDGKSDLNRISFQTTTGAASRGAVADLSTLQGAGSFEVIAVSNFNNGGGSTADQLFKGANNKYKYTTSTQKWDWEDPADKDWPTGNPTKYPIQFFAAYPFPAGLTWDGAEKAFIPAADVKDQVDQLAAWTTVSAKPISGIAPMDFQHILSAIKFQLKSTSGYKVNIKEIHIVNVTESRKFNYSTGEWSGPIDQKKTYTYFKSTNVASTQTIVANSTIAPISSGTFANTAISDRGQLMLVPQYGNPTDLAAFLAAADAWVADGKVSSAWPTELATKALAKGAYIEVVYNMTDGTKESDGTTDHYIVGKAGSYVRVFFPLDLTEAKTAQWDKSKRYTYTLYLGTPDSSNGTVMDPNYKDEDGGNTNTPIDNPAVDPGQPVTKGKITFTVDVSGWGEVGNDIK